MGDEFEDAIQGSFHEFLAKFPHIDTREEGERWEFRIRPQQPGPARVMSLMVTSSKQLLETTLLKAPDAELELPELGFTIAQDQKRQIDSLYNFIVVARDNLERHAT